MDQTAKQASLSANRNQSYWEFIDGLRAIAVLSVVLYHAGVRQIPGGFIGVDIFFVISGHLIIGQIMASRAKSNFSYSEFWSRRSLRILPPYLLVILISALIAPFVLVMPSEYEAFAKEMGYSAIMLVNHLFLSQQGYFDVGADNKVLLHLWSLAVEEQFYIFAPLIIAALSILRQRAFTLAVAALFAGSFVACIYWTGKAGDRNFSFFIMPLRAWEFIAGGIIVVAVPFVARLPHVAVEITALLGLSAIAYAATAFDNSIPFPSYYAAIPVLGASIVILTGLAQPNLVRSTLSIKPMIAIGLISYSSYLWHWPLLTFSRIYSFGEHNHLADATMVALSALLATFTYLCIERPIRRAREKRGLPLGWRPAIAGITLCLLLGVSSYFGFAEQSKNIAKNLAGNLLPTPPHSAGECDFGYMSSMDRCLAQHPNQPMGLLIGDSHAAAATRKLAQLATDRQSGLMVLAAGACISLITATTRIPDSVMAKNCRTYRERAKISLEIARSNFAILYSYWNIYSDPQMPYYFVDNEGKRLEDQKSAFLDGVGATLNYLRSVGATRILIIGPTPTFPRSAPECVVRAFHYGQSPDVRCAQPTQIEENRRSLAMNWLTAATAGQDDVRLIDPLPVFCDQKLCRPVAELNVLFNDTNHISDAGMAAIHNMYRESFDWVLTPD